MVHDIKKTKKWQELHAYATHKLHLLPNGLSYCNVAMYNLNIQCALQHCWFYCYKSNEQICNQETIWTLPVITALVWQLLVNSEHMIQGKGSNSLMTSRTTSKTVEWQIKASDIKIGSNMKIDFHLHRT